MSAERYIIEIQTEGTNHVVDLTSHVEAVLKKAVLASGLACIILPGSTGVVTTIEYEPGVVRDLIEAMERVAPQGIPYYHDAAWGDGNGFSHVRSALFGASFAFPFENRKPVLGTWQQIVFVECDNRSRKRRLILQLVG
jgi:secondary thiamine-phosphate synthase enzyme